MLRSLLSPLSDRFALSPRPVDLLSPAQHDNGEPSPEDFARDVLVEVMRNAVERLKVAEGLSARSQVLVEIHGIMVQDACTKEVFREMDGFLVLMNVLSTIQPTHSWGVAAPGDQIVHEVLEAVRLIFVIISEAIDDHKTNAVFFERSVGFEPLAQAIVTLVSDAKTVEQTLGFLTSFALHAFALSSIFVQSDDDEQFKYEDIDTQLHDLEPVLRFIKFPGALKVLYTSLPSVPEDKAPRIRYTVLKLLERLAYHSHRNHATLTTLDIVGSLFDQYCSGRGEPSDGAGSVLPKPERQIIVRLLKRLLELGVNTEGARSIFQRAVNKESGLDGDVLEVLRAGMKTGWPEHLSLEGAAALDVSVSGGLPHGGFTFMIWLRIERLPHEGSQSIFAFRMGQTELFSLHIRSNGTLFCRSSSTRDLPEFTPTLHLTKWTHVTLVHYPHRSHSPTIRLFLDGVLCDAVNWQYPKPDGSARFGVYTVGDMTRSAQMSYSIASAYLIGAPVGDDVPRFIQHLGPRYAGRFQADDLVKFMTYEASTSLSIFLSSVAQSKKTTTMSALIKNGVGVSAGHVLFILTPYTIENAQAECESNRVGVLGDVMPVRCVCLDLSMWRLGGAAIPLRFVQLAKTSHELSRTLAILANGMRNDWQNSDDMERLRGYELLADILRSKSDLINMTSFEILFEFLGLSFRSPDQSTIVNTMAYRVIALDLQLWSQTRTEIQHAHLEHFAMLLQTSKYKRFNVKQRLAKLNLVRKFIFALQTDWYQLESVPWLVDTLKLIAQADLSKDNTIKPIVAYLVANLHNDTTPAHSPHSVVSRIDFSSARLKAEQVLQMLVSILQTPTAFSKFAAALPVARICLLLLGDRPSPPIATNVLRLIEICLRTSLTFIRKFELVSGWNVLKSVLPVAWSESVQAAALNVLMGPASVDGSANLVVVCPQILPAIFFSLQSELNIITGSPPEHDHHDAFDAGPCVETLLVELINLHASSVTFRQAFQSQTVTQGFIDAFKSFLTVLSRRTELEPIVVRIVEKLSHLALSISLVDVVHSGQKSEIAELLQQGETLLNPNAAPHNHLDRHTSLGHRLKARRLPSMRLSVHLGERTVQRSISKIHEFRLTVTATERKRLRKNILDLREQRRQVAALTTWATVLTAERGLWPNVIDMSGIWRLDETEGPYRVRKKLEPELEKAFLLKVDKTSPRTRVQEPSSEAQSMIQTDTPPWSDNYDITAADSEDRFLEDDVVEDKLRRVRHELEPGDVIELAETVARVSGIDSTPGLLIFGQTHLYMLDGLVQDDEGEVIDARDAPKRLFFVPGSSLALSATQRAQRWSYGQLANYSDRTFLFRDVGLEIYFKDSRSLLVVFLDKAKRQTTTDKLAALLAPEKYLGDTLTTGLLKSPMMGRLSAKVSARVSARVLMGFKPDELATAQRKWQAREISNFTYISILNQVSGRTPSDATQYPVFPWVLQDYASEKLNLDSESVYRDLSKPMGALTPGRREAAISRYTSLQSVDEKPFHYGTHFSSSMIVCHFLIRLEPFSHMFKTLQGGDWDLPDRLFSDMKRAYESASKDLRGDVRELIPEFFTCPEFLENSANLDFGIQQNSGERIHHVKLPPWAKNDPLLFITLNRQALESDYVSRNLPSWIDLIWGCKQRDPDALNVFHPLSYEGSIDLDKITDELEREATVGIIHNFGQTPRKLFNSPHPDRMMHGTSTLPIGSIYGIPEDYHLLSQGHKVVRDLGAGAIVQDLVVDLIGEKIVPCAERTLAVPSHPHEIIEWDASHAPSGEMRVLVDKKVAQVMEAAFCSCAAFADSDTLVTGSTDYTVRLWRLVRGTSSHRPLTAQPTHIMRAHTAPVSCVAASRAWSLVVSGSQDGSAALWDLNRGVYVRSIWHGHGSDQAVHLAAIQDSTGYIATCSRERLWLHTVNARPICSLDLSDGVMSPTYPPITSLAFHEREHTKQGVLATGAPDGSITLRSWNTDNTPEGEKAQWEFVTLKKMKVKNAEGNGRTVGPCITALRFIGESLYHGEDTGKVYSWDLPD